MVLLDFFHYPTQCDLDFRCGALRLSVNGSTQRRLIQAEFFIPSCIIAFIVMANLANYMCLHAVRSVKFKDCVQNFIF